MAFMDEPAHSSSLAQQAGGELTPQRLDHRRRYSATITDCYRQNECGANEKDSSAEMLKDQTARYDIPVLDECQ